jgi:hypothetical protein
MDISFGLGFLSACAGGLVVAYIVIASSSRRADRARIRNLKSRAR